MCKKEFEVVGLNNQRSAYEVESFLSGLPNVDNVSADFITDTVVVEYDESSVEYGEILDALEHSGCVPDERIDGILDKFKARVL